MIPIGNLCLGHLIGTLRYFTVPTSKMYGYWYWYSLYCQGPKECPKMTLTCSERYIFKRNPPFINLCKNAKPNLTTDEISKLLVKKFQFGQVLF